MAGQQKKNIISFIYITAMGWEWSFGWRLNKRKRCPWSTTSLVTLEQERGAWR